MAVKTVQDLLVDELRDIYHAEKQLVKALPKMAKAAKSDKLRQAFEHHLEETRGQVERLEMVFERLERAGARQALRGDGRADRGGPGDDRGDQDARGARCGADHRGAEGRALRDRELRLGPCAGQGGSARTRSRSCSARPSTEEKAADQKLNQIALSDVNKTRARARPPEPAAGSAQRRAGRCRAPALFRAPDRRYW